MSTEQEVKEPNNPVINPEQGQDLLDKMEYKPEKGKEEEKEQKLKGNYDPKKYMATMKRGQKKMLESLAKQGLPFFESEEELLSYVRKLQEPKKVESDKEKEPNKEQEDLQKKIKALTKQLDKTEKEKIELIESNKRREQEFKTKQREEKLTELLATELKKAKCNSVELLSEHPSLRRRVEIDDDGFVIIKNKKGEEIGDENSFPDLIQEYKESNPQLFTVVQAINNKNNTTKKIFDINNGGVERPKSLHEQRGRLVAAIQNEFGAKLTKGG